VRWRRWGNAAAHRVDLIAIGNGNPHRARPTNWRWSWSTLLAGSEDVEDCGSEAALRYSARLLHPRNCRSSTYPARRVSIARRLQDPLAELVKIDPKAIGVGQYQHDLGESRLARSLDAWSETASTAVASTPTPLQRRCWRGCRHRRGPRAKHRCSIARQRPFNHARR